MPTPCSTPELPDGRSLLFAYGPLQLITLSDNRRGSHIPAWVSGMTSTTARGFATAILMEGEEVGGVLTVVDPPTLRAYDLYEGEGAFSYRAIATAIWSNSTSSFCCSAYIYIQRCDYPHHTNEEIEEAQEALYNGRWVSAHPFT